MGIYDFFLPIEQSTEDDRTDLPRQVDGIPSPRATDAAVLLQDVVKVAVGVYARRSWGNLDAQRRTVWLVCNSVPHIRSVHSAGPLLCKHFHANLEVQIPRLTTLLL